MQTTIDAVRAKFPVPALGVFLLRGDSLELAVSGFRKLGDPTPVMTKDKWHIGSCGKAMTATLVARLVESGALSWAARIPDFFPSAHPGYAQVTIRHLLAHRGGIVASTRTIDSGAFWPTLWDDSLDPREGRSRLAAKALALSPESTDFSYSNTSYAIAAHILELATGASYESLLRTEVFSPLGMTSAGFGPAGTPGEVDEPWGHGAGRDGAYVAEQGDNPLTIAPAGCMHLSLEDWSKFARAHLTDASQFLSDYSPLLTGDPGWVYTPGGWGLDVDGTLRHSGSNTLNLAAIRLSRRYGAALGVVCNTEENGGAEAVAAVIAKLWPPPAR